MVFSSYLFIFLFLPVFLLAYWASPRRARNFIILVASLIFYYIGEKERVWILVVAILGNYLAGWLIGRSKELGLASRYFSPRIFLAAGLLFNLCLLGYYKYAGFLAENINSAAAAVGASSAIVPVLHVVLPLGVSFFVFQGISYLIDVYRGTIGATSNLVNFAAYKSMFPQLIAGPIVRYKDVATELVHRSVTVDMFSEGVKRFVLGFCKKVLLADVFAVTADQVFSLPVQELSTGVAWLGSISYALQIYFDFSAYSDMAIGLALMMGFKFPENFNFPYTAVSIKDFWRRWHMTLSGWFRDYVYISLGGNRHGAFRTYVNLFAVFALTGLWHGASWTFVAWGMWHGAFMILERLIDFDRVRIPRMLKRAYVLFVVLIGWIFFRADNFSHAASMVAAMAGFAHGIGRDWQEFYNPACGLAIVIGVFLSMPSVRWLCRQTQQVPLHSLFNFLVVAVLFSFAGMKALSGAYSPFLYFRF